MEFRNNLTESEMKENLTNVAFTIASQGKSECSIEIVTDTSVLCVELKISGQKN